MEPELTQEPLNTSIASFVNHFQDVNLHDLSVNFSLENSVPSALNFSQTSYHNQSSIDLQFTKWEQLQKLANLTYFFMEASTSQQIYVVMIDITQQITQITYSGQNNLMQLGKNSAIFGRPDVLNKIKLFFMSEMQKLLNCPQQYECPKLFIVSLLSSISIKCNMANRSYFCDFDFLKILLDIIDILPLRNLECDVFIDLVALSLSYNVQIRDKICTQRPNTLLKLFFSNNHNFKSFKNLTIPSLCMLICSSASPLPKIFASPCLDLYVSIGLQEYIKCPSRISNELGIDFLKTISGLICFDMQTLFSTFQKIIRSNQQSFDAFTRVAFAISDILDEPMVQISISYYLKYKQNSTLYECTQNTLKFLDITLNKTKDEYLGTKSIFKYKYLNTINRYLRGEVKTKTYRYFQIPIFSR